MKFGILFFNFSAKILRFSQKIAIFKAHFSLMYTAQRLESSISAEDSMGMFITSYSPSCIKVHWFIIYIYLVVHGAFMVFPKKLFFLVRSYVATALLHYRLTFDEGNKKEIIHYRSWRELTKISKIPKFSCKMLRSKENMAMKNGQISLTFVLRAEMDNTLNYTLSPEIQKYTNLVNVACLYFRHFTTIRNQIWLFYKI